MPIFFKFDSFKENVLQKFDLKKVLRIWSTLKRAKFSPATSKKLFDTPMDVRLLSCRHMETLKTEFEADREILYPPSESSTDSEYEEAEN